MQQDFREKISVIVPVYNVEKYLDRCIRGIQAQTYQNLEIILVDDGSTDESGKMCDRYGEGDARIRVIHKENGGSSSARNKGIEIASGEYIGFLDADDYPDETMYEKLYQALKQNGNKTERPIAQVMSRDFDEQGNLLKDAYRSSGKLNFLTRKEMFRLLMLHEGDSSFCTKLIRGDFARRFRFSENRLNEDFELVLKMLMEIEGVYSLEEAHYNILIRQGSNQRSGFKPQLYEAVVDNSDFAYGIMEKEFPGLRRETERFYYFQRLDYLLHIPVERMKRNNVCYRKVLHEVRRGKRVWRENPFLQEKEKKNLMRLSLCPKLSKRVHGVIMKIRERRNG